MRRLYKWDKGKQEMVLIYEEGYNNKSAFVRDDTILDGLESPLTGEKYYSMSQYKRHLAAEGYEITGGDHFTGRGMMDFKHKTDMNEMRADVEKSLNDVAWGNANLSEKQKQMCVDEQRRLERAGDHVSEYHKHESEKFMHDFEKNYK